MEHRAAQLVLGANRVMRSSSRRSSLSSTVAHCTLYISPKELATVNPSVSGQTKPRLTGVDAASGSESGIDAAEAEDEVGTDDDELEAGPMLDDPDAEIVDIEPGITEDDAVAEEPGSSSIEEDVADMLERSVLDVVVARGTTHGAWFIDETRFSPERLMELRPVAVLMLALEM